MSGQIAGYAAPHELCALRPSLIGSASPRHRHRKLGAPREQLRGTWLKAWDADVTSRAQLERLPRRLNRDVVRVDFVVLVFGSSNTGESLPTRYRRMSLSVSRGSEGGRRSGPDHRDRYASNVALRVERVELDKWSNRPPCSPPRRPSAPPPATRFSYLPERAPLGRVALRSSFCGRHALLSCGA